MSKKAAIKQWLDTARENKQAAEDIFNAKHPEWAFFLYHLAIEKLLKGLIVKQGKLPPPVHDLAKLAMKANLTLSKSQQRRLNEITSYNIKARYADYKKLFYKKVTAKNYSEKWRKNCREIFLWLGKKY